MNCQQHSGQIDDVHGKISRRNSIKLSWYCFSDLSITCIWRAVLGKKQKQTSPPLLGFNALNPCSCTNWFPFCFCKLHICHVDFAPPRVFYACTFLSTALKMPSAALTPLIFSVITCNQYSMPNKGGQSTAIILTLRSNVAFPEFKHELFKFRGLVFSALRARKWMSSNTVPCQGSGVQTR